MALMGYREYARHRGCALSAVQKAIKTGRIVTTEGKIDSEAADQRWVASTDPAKQRKAPPPPPQPPAMPLIEGELQVAPAIRRPSWPEWPEPWPPPVVKQPEGTPSQDVVEMDTFLRAKTERERAEAELAKLELLEKQGRLIDAEEARQTWQAIGAMFARSRENVPVQLATQLAGKTDLGEIERTIRKVFRDADERIANEIEARFSLVAGNVRHSGLAS